MDICYCNLKAIRKHLKNKAEVNRTVPTLVYFRTS